MPIEHTVNVRATALQAKLGGLNTEVVSPAFSILSILLRRSLCCSASKLAIRRRPASLWNLKPLLNLPFVKEEIRKSPFPAKYLARHKIFIDDWKTANLQTLQDIQ